MSNTTLETHPTVNACLWCGKDKGTRAKYCSRTCGKKYGYRASRATAPRCSEQGCDKPVQARGMCGPHYSTWYRNTRKKHNYTCYNCGVDYWTGRKQQRDKTFCSTQCQRTWAYTNPEHRARIKEGTERYIATLPAPVKKCARCNASFNARAAASKYCSEGCKKEAAKDRRLKLLSPLRYAYEHGDNAGIIAALKDGSTITPNGCWEWKTIRDGYPRAMFGNKHIAVHRLSLEAKYGAPLGEQAAHHMCANTKCVNPDHLQPVTHRENVAEMLARNSYLNRIRELEEALEKISPGHELLNRIPVK